MGYEQQRDFDQASGADEELRETMYMTLEQALQASVDDIERKRDESRASIHEQLDRGLRATRVSYRLVQVLPIGASDDANK